MSIQVLLNYSCSNIISCLYAFTPVPTLPCSVGTIRESFRFLAYIICIRSPLLLRFPLHLSRVIVVYIIGFHPDGFLSGCLSQHPDSWCPGFLVFSERLIVLRLLLCCFRFLFVVTTLRCVLRLFFFADFVVFFLRFFYELRHQFIVLLSSFI